MFNSKYDLTQELRERITDGIYSPGDRLPTRMELVAEFGGSNKTIQCALSALVAEGYVETRGKAGSFVAPRPPHLTRICLVFEEDFLETCSFNRLFQAIHEELPVIEKRHGVSFEIIDNVRMFTNAGKLEQLVADVHARRLAGLFFLAVPKMLVGTPLLDDPEIARVALCSRVTLVRPSIYPDYLDFFRRAAGELKRFGCRRPALLVPEYCGFNMYDQLMDEFARAGWALRPRDFQLIRTEADGAVENLVELLFSGDRSEFPDSLVLADDNKLLNVTTVLKRLGHCDVRVVSLANFPYPAPSAFPVTRIGFEVSGILEKVTCLILDQLSGRPVPDFVPVPARLESEIQP